MFLPRLVIFSTCLAEVFSAISLHTSPLTEILHREMFMVDGFLAAWRDLVEGADLALSAGAWLKMAGRLARFVVVSDGVTSHMFLSPAIFSSDRDGREISPKSYLDLAAIVGQRGAGGTTGNTVAPVHVVIATIGAIASGSVVAVGGWGGETRPPAEVSTHP